MLACSDERGYNNFTNQGHGDHFMTCDFIICSSILEYLHRNNEKLPNVQFQSGNCRTIKHFFTFLYFKYFFVTLTLNIFNMTELPTTVETPGTSKIIQSRTTNINDSSK